MKTNLSFSKQVGVQLMLILAIFFSTSIFGQTTLVNFPFTNTPAGNGFNPDVVDPSYDGITLPIPTLTYGPSTVRYFNNNMLEFVSENDFLTMSINTVGKSGMTLSFDGVADLSFLSFWADVVVSANIGAGGAFITLPNGTFNVDQTLKTFSVNLPNTAIKSDLKIRLKYNKGVWGNDIVRIDNLKITAASPNIKVYTAGNKHIPHLSPASVVLTTDFGVRQTTAAALTKAYRVRNYAGPTNSSLIVNNITVSGANPGDFTVTPTTLTALGSTTNETATSGNSQRAFTISFKPLSDGIRTAKINLYSNAAPSPYIFTVVGVGASCSLETTTYTQNDFDLQQTLESGYTTADLIGGVANPGGSNTLGVSLYPAGYLYSSANKSIMFNGNTAKTINFGGSVGENIVNKKDVSIVFNLAAFTKTTRSAGWFYSESDYTENGLNLNSTVKLQVLSEDNTTWLDGITIRGSNNSDQFYRYNFTGMTTATGTLGQSNSFDNSNGTKYNIIKLDIPATAGISNLKFRIIGKTENTNKYWLIDDVRILSKNAIFKVWSTNSSGTNLRWRNADGNNAAEPTIDEKAFIDGNYIATKPNFEACECEVNPGKTLTIGQDKVVTLRGALINKGIVNINSDGNLIQEEDDAVNIGNITAYRDMTPRRNSDDSYSAKEYSFYSSPVYGQNMRAIFGGNTVNTAFALVLNEPGNNFVNASAAQYNIKGKGFAVKDPIVAFVGTKITVPTTFVGKPNNGIVKVPVTLTGTKGWNLVGNPYPSNLDLKTFYTDNSTVMDKDIRFWDKTVNATYSQYGGSYKGYSYAIYNADLDIGNPAPGGDLGNNTGGGGSTPDIPGKYRYAKVGQGFLIRSKQATDTLIFKNNLRTATQGDLFFGKNSNEDDRDVYRLQLITPGNLALTQTIVYVDGANNSFDIEDTKHPSLSSSDAFYSIAEEEKLLINGRNSFQDTDVVNIGVKNYVAGLYKIRAIHQSGIFSNGRHIYLKDHMLNVIADLTEAPYEFSSESGEFTNRFEIVYDQGAVLGATNQVKASVDLYRDGQDFVVQTSSKKIVTVDLYDMSGRLMFSKKANAKTVRFTAETLTEGIYILKGQLEGGEVFTKKLRK